MAETPRDYRCRFEGKFKTLRSLLSEQGIELGFFPQLQNYRPHPGEPRLAKVGPRDFLKLLIIGHTEAFVLVKSCNSIKDVWVHPCSETSWVRKEWHTGSLGGQLR